MSKLGFVSSDDAQAGRGAGVGTAVGTEVAATLTPTAHQSTLRTYIVLIMCGVLLGKSCDSVVCVVV